MYNWAENATNLRIQRTKHPMRWKKLTTMNMGKLTPIACLEVLPGDTFKMDMKMLMRATTLIKPLMDNMWVQVSAFFVPNRLVDKHWEEIMGENKEGPFITNKTTYEVPRITAPTGGWNNGTIADHFGIPTKVQGLEINSHPFKAYCQIWNDYFRDENIQNYTHITLEGDIQGSNGNNYVTDAEKGGELLPVCKVHDYFTSAIQEPQKGPDVMLPIGGIAPVVGNGYPLSLSTNQGHDWVLTPSQGTNGDFELKALWSNKPGQSIPENYSKMPFNWSTDKGVELQYTASAYQAIGVSENPEYSGLVADITKTTEVSVNEFRLAVALQQMYELDARGGTRYIEIIKNHFGVQSSDARLQRAEYLGGKNIPIQITQIIQTSSTDDISAQGNTAGMSLTFDQDAYFTKSFEEHGFIIMCACIKQEQTYQQGLPRMFSRFKRTDFYDPIFANIGEQPIYNREIYAQGNNLDEEVFGYNEAWADYRYKPNQVSGEFRSNDSASLDFWHLANDFASLPTLGEDFIIENKNNLDRALTVPSTMQNQFIADFYFDAVAVRPMPPHSVPGLKRL